jgi:hypothetical protein
MFLRIMKAGNGVEVSSRGYSAVESTRQNRGIQVSQSYSMARQLAGLS